MPKGRKHSYRAAEKLGSNWNKHTGAGLRRSHRLEEKLNNGLARATSGREDYERGTLLAEIQHQYLNRLRKKQNGDNDHRGTDSRMYKGKMYQGEEGPYDRDTPMNYGSKGRHAKFSKLRTARSPGGTQYIEGGELQRRRQLCK